MTDSSSEMADMAAELVSSKIESARKDTQMTHVLRIGNFHMEVVPSEKVDIEKMFKETLSMLMKEYDDKLLEVGTGNETFQKQAHYQ
mgnify:CR=1 FL=1|jgi:hypothetical protein|tara:strand:- start:525 stop:785 length:261 start_codon:yes stop_codon:yes gene_type:complete